MNSNYKPTIVQTMKKIFLIMVLAVTIVGCRSVESKAKSQMKETLKEMANDPSSVEISDVEVIFESDSTIVIECSLKANNRLGNAIKTDIEYIYVIGENNTYERVKDLSNKRRSINVARESFDKLGYDTYGTESTPSFADYFESVVRIDAMFSGRKVK